MAEAEEKSDALSFEVPSPEPVPSAPATAVSAEVAAWLDIVGEAKAALPPRAEARLPAAREEA